VPRHAGGRHCLGRENLVQLRLAQQAALEHQRTDRPPGLDRQFGNLGCLSVPDIWTEGCRDGGAAIEQLAASVYVRFDASHAALVEDPDRVGEDPSRVQRIPRDDRHHHVQFELSCIGAGEDRGVAAEHLVADLVDHLRDGWIDLAGHDRRARLNRRQADFGDPGARAHAEQAQVGRDLAHLDGQSPKRRGHREHVAHALGDAEAIVSGAEREIGFFSEVSDRALGEVVARIQPCADRGRAEVQLVQRRRGTFEIHDRVPYVGREAAELLP
jgi:hypothetical protein